MKGTAPAIGWAKPCQNHPTEPATLTTLTPWRWWGRIPADALLCALPPTAWAVLAELARHAALWPDRETVRWDALDGLAHPATINRAADRLEAFGLIEVERTPGGNRTQARLVLSGRRWVPVPLVDPRRLDDDAHKLLPALWAVSESTLADRHRRKGTDPLDAWTADQWSTPDEVVDLTGTSHRTAQRNLAKLADAGLIERTPGDHETPHTYRPCWHLWATRRGESVRAPELRARHEMSPAEVLEALAESGPIARQIARPSRDPVSPSITSTVHSSYVSNSLPPNTSVGEPDKPKGGDDSHSRPRTTAATHREADELRTALIESGGTWSHVLAYELEPPPAHRQRLADAIAVALDDGWSTETLASDLDWVDDLPSDPRHPTALLAHRVSTLIEQMHPPSPLVDGYADFEPERYTTQPARVFPGLDPRNMRQHVRSTPATPNSDSHYHGLIKAGLIDEAARYACERYAQGVA